MAGSLFRGGFLVAPGGHGKSLTALLAAIESRGATTPAIGFVLVVCRDERAVAWEKEINKHFTEASCPARWWNTHPRR